MDQKSNRISVVICTFNGERYIKEQLESIINQTRRPDEIIICDDQSSDGTVSIIREILARVSINYTLIINEQNLGVNKNFEKAIKYCTGNIIFTSDQDDCWLVNKIELIENQFETCHNTLLIFTDGYIVDENLRSLDQSLWEIFHFSSRDQMIWKTSLLELLLNRNVVTGATMAFRAELCEKILPFGESWFFDHWIATIAAINGDVLGLPEMTIKYRIHGKNVVGAVKETFPLQLKKYFNNYSKEFLQNKRIIYQEMLSQLSSRIDSGKMLDIDSSDRTKNTVNECYNFWSRRAQIYHEANHKSIIKIHKDLFRGNYKRFYTGLRGAVRDIVSIFF